MQTTTRHMLRWQIDIQEYRGNINIIYKGGKRNTNEDSLSRWPLDNVNRNLACVPKVALKIPIHFMKVDRRTNYRFSEWESESGTLNNGNNELEEKETPTIGKSSSEIHPEFFNSVIKSYTKHLQCSILILLLQKEYRSPVLESQLEEPWLRNYKDDRFFVIE
ncbi:hypothetical protein O181_055384 [Austropuccinia psidii MF-1]|uniref:Uncharacterized protein n=1 Tax=Austropuccinia psidii MF-1 TaxID=1389203 RepID=A0A9Q3E6D0_9BASI|nr:hypothetical protein [Austropuccinia psidii MF-1]